MAGQLYRVVFEGEILEGSQVQEVKRALAKLYNTREDQMERFFSRKRLAVKKDMDYETAMKYVKAFERAGAICRVEEIETHTGQEQPLMLEKETEEPIQQDDGIVCPKCQFEQAPSEECVRCGIIISKYSERFDAPESQTESRGIEEDYIAFIGDNADKYIPKFKKFNQGGVDNFAATWHWPAFFLGPWWLLYRKLHGWGSLAIVLDVIPGVNVLSKIGFALAGNYIYYKHAKDKIKELRRSRPSSDLAASLANIGGVHRWMVSLTVVVFILSLAGVAFIGYSELSAEKKIGKIAFYTDYDQGLDQAFEAGKPVMLVFSASWCGACKKMTRDVFSNDEVADASGQLVNIYIDVDKVDRELVQEYEIKSVPSVFFLDYSGETIIQVADKRSPEDFIENIDYMAQAHSHNQLNKKNPDLNNVNQSITAQYLGSNQTK